MAFGAGALALPLQDAAPKTASGTISGQPTDQLIVSGQLAATTGSIGVTPACTVLGQLAASSGGVMLQVSRVRARALVAQGRRL